MTEEEKWIRRIERERNARQEAERLLEAKSLELFEKNRILESTLENLESLVEERTREVKRLSLVASKATCGVVITDADGRVEWVNDGFTRISGYSLDDIIGRVPGKVLQGEDSDPETVAMMSSMIKSRRAFTAEILNYTKSRSPYWVRLDANPIFGDNGELQSFVSIQTDITEQKLYEERMALLTKALEQSSDGFALTDSSGFFTYLNKEHVRIFGYEKAEELIGKSWEVLYDKEEIERLKKEVFSSRMSNRTWKGIARAVRRNGQTFPEDLGLTLLQDGRIICTCRDDSVRAEAEMKLRSAMEESKSLNEELKTTVTELDAYAHTVAHDLNNPIHGITGITETLQAHWSEMEDIQRREFVDIIHESTLTLENIVRELLVLSSVRKESIELGVVDLNACCQKAQNRLRHMIIAATATIQIKDTLKPVMGYGPWIEEVFSNLISNAIKYGGRPPAIEVSSEILETGVVCIHVDDNGDGIEAHKRALLFKEFSRTHSKTEGHGLGLSIVLRIINKLGGTVGISDSPMGGARFFFTLPAAKNLNMVQSKKDVNWTI